MRLIVSPFTACPALGGFDLGTCSLVIKHKSQKVKHIIARYLFVFCRDNNNIDMKYTTSSILCEFKDGRTRSNRVTPMRFPSAEAAYETRPTRLMRAL